MKKTIFLINASIFLTGWLLLTEGCTIDPPTTFDCEMVSNLQIISPLDSICLDIDSLDDATIIVTGTAIGVQNQDIMGYLYVLLFPTQPNGGGWYVQSEADFENDSNWFTSIQLGDREERYIPKDRDEFKLVAIVTPYKETMDSLLRSNPARVSNLIELPKHTSSAFANYLVRVKDSCR